MGFSGGQSTRGSSCPLFLAGIGIKNIGFNWGRKTRRPGEKPSEQGREPLGIEPGPQCWEAGALTNVLPKNTTGAAILNPNRILTQVAGSTTLLYCILCLPSIAIIFKRLSASRLDYKSITVGALVFADYREKKWESLYQKAYSEYNFNDIADIILYLFVFT